MRDIKYLAALGTILIFLGFYLIKASVSKSIPIHGSKMKFSNKVILIVFGILSLAGGVFLIGKAISKI